MTHEQEIKLLEQFVSISKDILNEFNKTHSQLAILDERLKLMEQRLASKETSEHS